MHKIAIFGKGGIGKSTLSANLAVVFARQGRRVLLVGCDPKHDTTVAVTEGKPIPTVVEQSMFMGGRGNLARLVVTGRHGIDCVEAGGPEPGIGCAGRGVSRMIEVLEEAGGLKDDRYDIILFDVLGDVVCGGFAAPLRKGLADRVCIVMSEELMALYAANNIARAVRNYTSNGVRLVGMVANLRDPGADRESVERFATLIGTRVLTFLPRTTVVRQAEYKRLTVVEHAPEAEITQQIEALAAELLRIEPDSTPAPTPLSDERFHQLSRQAFVEPEPQRQEEPAMVAAPAPPPRPSGDRPTRPDPRMHERPDANPKLQAALAAALRLKKKLAADPRLKEKLAANPKLQATLAAAIDLQRNRGPHPTHGPDERDDRSRVTYSPEGPDGVAISAQRGDHHNGSDGSRVTYSPEGPDGVANSHHRGDHQHGSNGSRETSNNAGPDGIPSSQQWGSLSQWRNFFCDQEAQRNAQTGLQVDMGVLQIKHQDMECEFATPSFNNDLVSFFNFPWLRQSERAASIAQSQTVSSGDQNPMRQIQNMTTDLRDHDVIRGGGQRLKGALERAATHSEGVEAIVVHSTCVPTVIGDDAEGIIDAFRDKLKVPIIYTNPASNKGQDVGSVLFRGIQEKLLAPAERRDRCINLVGFPRCEAMTELITLLRATGIEVNQWVMPRLTMEQARNYLTAGLQVFYPNARYEKTYRETFEILPIESITPAAPYGMAGSRAWLQSVAAHFHLEESAGAAFDRVVSELASQWEPAREVARTRQLAFILDTDHLERLNEPKTLFGIPMIAVLEEMGFGVEVLLFGEDFKTPAELEKVLREGTFAAAYSEFFFDERLTRVGKRQFSVSAFEMSPAGALRTLERLNHICQWPFYERYARYLGKRQ